MTVDKCPVSHDLSKPPAKCPACLVILARLTKDGAR